MFATAEQQMSLELFHQALPLHPVARIRPRKPLLGSLLPTAKRPMRFARTGSE